MKYELRTKGSVQHGSVHSFALVLDLMLRIILFTCYTEFIITLRTSPKS